MTVLVTGAAGFIGYHVAERLLARGERVVRLDDTNPSYNPNLKQLRAGRLAAHSDFGIVRADIADPGVVVGCLERAGWFIWRLRRGALVPRASLRE